ncbi:DUF4198 domain-containing protein [Aliidiomarina shirensis]|uniref:DUF4198 domain-containing protein n=1 Tax=Aliidiomarina shirensis TaxID=1048642 RepID=A0A432WSV2_9GAMM|nr:DUF4198 domain-containing protein [Aliidiomarina shirensis]RUO36818.1 DUF4198 domain-containing protein [Aliidiomarina shirensis]
MKKRILLTLPILLLAATPEAMAHRAWLLPSSTVLASDQPWVTIDAAISNEIFHLDYRPMGTSSLQVAGPEGSSPELTNTFTGKFRSHLDLQLAESGTYKVYTASHGLNARWVDENGERGGYPQRGQQGTTEGLQAAIPENTQELTISEFSRRIETFMTSGAPDDHALEPTGKGLELNPITHPNDLFSGETATFQLLIDGEPAVGAEIEIIPGNTRYRDTQEQITTVTDGEGMLNVTWPQAGMYWFNATYTDNQAVAPATQRRGSYTATLEVLPE